MSDENEDSADSVRGIRKKMPDQEWVRSNCRESRDPESGR